MKTGSKVYRFKVFISYSRSEISIASKLRDDLIEKGVDAYLDIHNIAPGEPWQERLRLLISEADRVIFLISPSSYASKMCSWEVDEAESQAKRIIPIRVVATPDEFIPGRLRRLNFLSMESEEEWRVGVDSLPNAFSNELA